jgi:ribosomal protein S6--L-glutamate ligase
VTERFVIGWEEWLALPALGLPAIKAKVDTGAKTSALHAFMIEPFQSPGGPMVRFGVHPVPGREEIEIFCSAPVTDQREVTSSNGEREMRYVITTAVRLGEREWPIEITLTNREAMTYRMLLGRQAIRDDMFVDPATSFRQPRLGYRLYRDFPRRSSAPRPLRIALVTRRPRNASNARLAAAAAARGHALELLDRARISLFIDAEAPALLFDGQPMPHYDAVIPRFGPKLTSFGTAIVRQFELLGSFALNGADALARTRDILGLHQTLAGSGISAPSLAVAYRTDAKASSAEQHVITRDLTGEPDGVVRRFLVVGGRALAAIERPGRKETSLGIEEAAWHACSPPPPESQRRIAESAASALGLGLAAVDVVLTPRSAFVAQISATPALGLLEKVSGEELAGPIVDYIASQVRSAGSRVRADRSGAETA